VALSTVILTAKALVTACDKFEHPGRVERMFQLCRSCDGSAFGVFIAVERIVCQELVQNGETHNKLLSAKFGLCREWSCVSESNFCAEFRICCAVPSVGRALSRGGSHCLQEGRTVCPDGLSQGFQRGAVLVGVHRTSMCREVHQQHTERGQRHCAARCQQVVSP
jgi:hypothetical protein